MNFLHNYYAIVRDDTADGSAIIRNLVVHVGIVIVWQTPSFAKELGQAIIRQTRAGEAKAINWNSKLSCGGRQSSTAQSHFGIAQSLAHSFHQKEEAAHKKPKNYTQDMCDIKAFKALHFSFGDFWCHLYKLLKSVSQRVETHGKCSQR